MLLSAIKYFSTHLSMLSRTHWWAYNPRNVDINQLIIISHLTLLRGLKVLDKFPFEFWKHKTRVIILGSHMLGYQMYVNAAKRMTNEHDWFKVSEY